MIPQAESYILTEVAITHLVDALKESIGPEEFFARADAIVINKENLILLPISPGPADPLNTDLKSNPGAEGNNSTMVHEYIGEIDKANAADSRLWTYLAFVTYRDYMVSRWPVDKDAKNWRERIRDRWLLTNLSRARLMRHGIARLWWIACLTWDASGELPLSKEKQDRYAYTRQAFANEDYVVGIFERNIGAMPSVVRAVLENLSERGASAGSTYLRTMIKALNLTHGYRDIGLLNSDDLHTLIRKIAPTV